MSNFPFFLTFKKNSSPTLFWNLTFLTLRRVYITGGGREKSNVKFYRFLAVNGDVVQCSIVRCPRWFLDCMWWERTFWCVCFVLAQAFYAQTLCCSFMFIIGAFCCMLVCDADAVLWLRFVFYPASRFCSKEYFWSRHPVMASAPVEVEKKLLQQQLQEMGSEELSSMVEDIKFLETCMRSKNKDSRIQRGVSLHEQKIRVEKVQKGARKLLAVCRFHFI